MILTAFCQKLLLHFFSEETFPCLDEDEGLCVHFQVQKVERVLISWPSLKNFSELRTIFSKSRLGS